MDLNLVKVFVAIYETKSLTQAGERLYVSQSAISQSLNKLRTEFNETLFERNGREMSATQFADEIYPKFRLALKEIQSAVSADKVFDPLTSERKFRLGLSELGEIGWLPEILKVVQEKAPNVHLEVVHLENYALVQDLNRGNLDVAISPMELPGISDFILLKKQSYVLILSPKNPFAEKPLTSADYAQASRVEVISDSGNEMLAAVHRRIPGLRKPVARIQHFATLASIISGNSNLMAAVPEAIAVGWSNHSDIILKKLPFKMEPINLRMYRRMTSDARPALDWFFKVVSDAVRSHSAHFETIGGD